jgi:hypothetical protein
MYVQGCNCCQANAVTLERVPANNRLFAVLREESVFNPHHRTALLNAEERQNRGMPAISAEEFS